MADLWCSRSWREEDRVRVEDDDEAPEKPRAAVGAGKENEPEAVVVADEGPAVLGGVVLDECGVMVFIGVSEWCCWECG